MKKILFALATFLIFATGLKADEGMWLLPLLEKLNQNEMKALGCRLSADEIYSINHSSLKDAIVHFGGGCTGEIISEEGLLITNHHCGYGSIQQLSTDEHNYLENGYWAMRRNEELPVPGLTVTFMEYMQDVTKDLEKCEKKAAKEFKNDSSATLKINNAVSSLKKELVKKAEKDFPNCDVEIKSYYNENVFYLIAYKVYKDIRFVGAPPASVGKFGGDIDNWMWPRHTCDFSMFRVYAGKDNEPAEYSEENVPYIPKQSLKVSLKGVQPNDFAMIIGYPGRTQRYMTTAELNNMLDINDIRIAARTVRQNIMMEAMQADPSIRLKYADKYASSSNGWKKWIGEKKAFKKLQIIEKETAKEADFTKWVNAKKKRTNKYGKAIEDIASAIKNMKNDNRFLNLYLETYRRIELSNFASTFLVSVKSKLKVDKQKDTLKAMNSAFEEMISKNTYRDYFEPLDRKMAVKMIEFYRNNADKQYYPQIEGENFETLNIENYVNHIFDNSKFSSKEKLQAAINNQAERRNLFKDIALDFNKSLRDNLMTCLNKVYAGPNKKALNQGQKDYTAGLLAWNKGKAMYPDANSSMRLTYGTVKGYSPRDAVNYNYYTTVNGVKEKYDPEVYEFNAPEKLIELIEDEDFGRYATQNGQMPACFLTNNDITGGNSGSPVLDADGNLIGLAFDGNWESLSSDVLFDKNLQRCINVDIRYVLFIIDKLGGASHIIDEMTLVE